MRKLFGDKDFLKRVATVAIPIIIQNGISNFVSLLDNIMVGRIGTEQMSGVAIVNQLMFVFFLALFGAISGPGIFTAQYVGQKNNEGIRHTVRIKLLYCAVIAIAGIVIFTVFQNDLIMLFLHQTTDNINLEETLHYAKSYMQVMLFGMPLFAITQSYAGTLRESGETKVPMVAGIVATFVNLGFNYILIFGHFGAPKLGVVGAAIATDISRVVEFLIIVVWTHRHKERCPFVVGLYKGFEIPKSLFVKVTIKGFPLFLNELMWSMGMSALTQCYSTRGLEVVAAFNIANTIVNLFNVVLISMGNVVAIIIGQVLGSGDTEEVVDTDNKLIRLSVCSAALMGILLIITAPLFPKFYNTSDYIRDFSVSLMRVSALFMPVSAFLNAAYFTIRSGGKTFITFLFDSVYLWVLCWPVAYYLSRYTSIAVIPMYASVLALDFIKLTVGLILIKKKIWIQNLVK